MSATKLTPPTRAAVTPSPRRSRTAIVAYDPENTTGANSVYIPFDGAELIEIFIRGITTTGSLTISIFDGTYYWSRVEDMTYANGTGANQLTGKHIAGVLTVKRLREGVDYSGMLFACVDPGPSSLPTSVRLGGYWPTATNKGITIQPASGATTIGAHDVAATWYW